jgi:branched-chain amino acid transport system ATP-binding protein
MSLFEVKNITVAFGGVKALNDVSFGVDKGEIFTIIGPNGAGKSTLFNVISRIYEPSKGEIYFENQNISKTKPHNISKLGIARTFQNLELFENATVLQNLLLGRHIYKKQIFYLRYFLHPVPVSKNMNIDLKLKK